jgi:uncharacterized protein YjbI with pentapeptide repeats
MAADAALQNQINALNARIDALHPPPDIGNCSAPPAPGVDWHNCNLTGAELTYADLAGSNLSGANLSGAHLAGSNLSNANLSNANLSGAELDGANLDGANLTGAILDCTGHDICNDPV